MSESVAARQIEYRDLIREVYIDPIRTVVVIDDEFPSLDGLIAEKWDGENQSGTKKEDAEKVKNILAACRRQDRRWLVDIHDGKNDYDQSIASHLHQSDLMILDYHLDGNDGSGDKAIAILRELAANDHFNMVIVYTKGYGNHAGDIGRVIREIAIGLSSKRPNLILNKRPLDEATEYIQEWEDNEGADFIERLKQAVDDDAYLTVVSQEKVDWKEVIKLPQFSEFYSILENSGNKPEKLTNNLLLQWLIHSKQETLEGKLSCKGYGKVNFHYDANGKNWIRTSRLFITVIHKEENSPDSLPDKLLDALNQWDPEPHRLLMAKMRAVLDARGVLAEEDVLDNPYLQSAWFEELLIEDISKRTLNVIKSVDRHWEGLSYFVQSEVIEYANRVTEYLCGLNRTDAIKKYCPVDVKKDRNQILAEANCYHCTKTIEGNHLTTGHVLKIGSELWLCLSPACDLEPGQEKGWAKNLVPNMPFKAVRLYDCDLQKGLESANFGNHIFARINSEIKALSFLPGNSESSNPRWEQMFAVNHGKFNSSRQIKIKRIKAETEQLNFSDDTALVIAHLRYEYALNLLNRLSASLSRVGLNFQALQKEPE